MGSLPRLATISRDFELRNTHVGIHDLHAEPVRGGAGFVLQCDGGGDAAGNNRVADGDYARGLVRDGGVGVCEEVEVRGVTLGAFVYDLDMWVSISMGRVWVKRMDAGHTIALMGFPFGPVTETQTPHLEASQFWPLKAVPKTPEGSV